MAQLDTGAVLAAGWRHLHQLQSSDLDGDLLEHAKDRERDRFDLISDDSPQLAAHARKLAASGLHYADLQAQLECKLARADPRCAVMHLLPAQD